MQVEWVDPLVAATQNVFSKMLSCELTYTAATEQCEQAPEFEFSGCIGLSGDYRGVVVVSLGREMALAVAEIFLGERPTELNTDVTDAVGELTNMIAGAAKTLLNKEHLSVGLPTVVLGKSHSFAFPSRSVPVCLPFESSIGSLQVEVGIVASPTRA